MGNEVAGRSRVAYGRVVALEGWWVSLLWGGVNCVVVIVVEAREEIEPISNCDGGRQNSRGG